MSFLWTKKPPFDKTTWSNDKTKVSCTEKWARKIFGTYDQYHGLTRFKICQYFDYSKMSFLRSKKPPFDKTTWSNDKTKVSCTEKWAWKICGTSDQNHMLTRFKICKFFAIVKRGFYGLKSLLLRKQHQQTTRQMSLLQKSRLEGYLELLIRIMR